LRRHDNTSGPNYSFRRPVVSIATAGPFGRAMIGLWDLNRGIKCEVVLCLVGKRKRRPQICGNASVGHGVHYFLIMTMSRLTQSSMIEPPMIRLCVRSCYHWTFTFPGSVVSEPDEGRPCRRRGKRCLSWFAIVASSMQTMVDSDHPRVG
jgi:hypothetical protein